jgi:hypothetical protein
MFFDRVHFDGMIKISGVDIEATLKSQVYRDWDSEESRPWETWHYHLVIDNHEKNIAEEKGINTSEKNSLDRKPEYRIPYISGTGFRSDFFSFEKKPSDLKVEDVKHILEERVKVLLGKNLSFIPKDIKPVEVVSNIPEESWEVKDE